MAHPNDLKFGAATICWSETAGWVLPGRQTTTCIVTALAAGERLHQALRGKHQEPSAPSRIYVRRPAGRNSSRWPVSVP